MEQVSFRQREERRASEFAEVWAKELPEAFTQVAKYYDRANAVASLGLWNKWREKFIKGIKTEPGMKVLDVCAGTNAIGIGLLRRQPDLEVHAIDGSAAMQRVGTADAEKAGFHIDSVIADVHKLPFPDNYFDIVTLEAASRHMRLNEVFHEIKRVLKPGGTFHHCDMLRPDNKVVEHLYYAYLSSCLAVTGAIFRSHNAAWTCKSYFVKAIRMFYSTKELAVVLDSIGFESVAAKSVAGGVVGFHRAMK